MYLFTCEFSHKRISVPAECALHGRAARVFGRPDELVELKGLVEGESSEDVVRSLKRTRARAPTTRVAVTIAA